ncbi:MAG TPA: GNAT family N-acetyltransferase [Actinoplanes sp.]
MDSAAQVHFRRARRRDVRKLGHSLGREHGAYFRARVPAQARGEGRILVAIDAEGMPVGAVWVSWTRADEPEVNRCLPDVPLLYHFEVQKEMRGLKIGTRLLRYAEATLRAAGFHRVALGVDEWNIDARRLYERLGYRAGVPELQGLRTQSTGTGEHEFLDPFDILIHQL